MEEVYVETLAQNCILESSNSNDYHADVFEESLVENREPEFSNPIEYAGDVLVETLEESRDPEFSNLNEYAADVFVETLVENRDSEFCNLNEYSADVLVETLVENCNPEFSNQNDYDGEVFVETLAQDCNLESSNTNDSDAEMPVEMPARNCSLGFANLDIDDADISMESSAKNCNHDFSDQNTSISLKHDAAQTEESVLPKMNQNDILNGTMEIGSDEEQTLPILQKIVDLSNKVRNLKKEHTTLCEDVKAIAEKSFPGCEVLAALQELSTEYESLKKNYHEQCKSLTEKCENIKKKYLEEALERKRLYNEVIELKGNIRVFCRCRPLNQEEIVKGSNSTVNLDASNENELQIVCSDSSKKQFKFDHVFGPEKNQEDVFLQTSPIVTSVLDGYNVCIFAYGQTGTGKTFTMEGNQGNRGVNYRTLEELFRISNERNSVMRYELFVSMLEVYNERIRDLLADNSNRPSKKLEIKQGADGTQEVPGLTEARVYGTNEVWELLKTGSRARSVGSTSANELSSRSHCLLRVTVKGESLINGNRTRSHLWLVDLAGSERVGRIEVEGERLKESQFINKSLSALGDVISALASKTAHIPYRNSKLTHMLQSSLGGDCKTLMFVQISPSSTDLGETLCSLNFASRVRGIEHGPARKQTDVAELQKYKQLAEKAKHDEKETKKLQDSLQSLQLRLSSREHVCRTLQEKVRDLENKLEEERKNRLKQENRALASLISQAPPPTMSSTNQLQKRPPLAPSKLRMPLRKITNICPQPTPVPPSKTRFSASFFPIAKNEKENISNQISSTSKPRKILQARRGSIAIKPTYVTNQTVQPRRRASVAILPSEATSSFARSQNSLVSDSKRVWRMSRVFSPHATSAVMSTPAAAPRSSKFMGSPPVQGTGSWKPKNPTVIALQKKQLVWSPLKMRGFRNSRRSFTPMFPN